MCLPRWRSTRTARTAVPAETRRRDPTDLAGTITHAGTEDIENVYVNWGDGSSVDSGALRPGALPGDGDVQSGLRCGPRCDSTDERRGPHADSRCR